MKRGWVRKTSCDAMCPTTEFVQFIYVKQLLL